VIINGPVPIITHHFTQCGSIHFIANGFKFTEARPIPSATNTGQTV